jgi:hypothetical protein
MICFMTLSPSGIYSIHNRYLESSTYVLTGMLVINLKLMNALNNFMDTKL